MLFVFEMYFIMSNESNGANESNEANEANEARNERRKFRLLTILIFIVLMVWWKIPNKISNVDVDNFDTKLCIIKSKSSYSSYDNLSKLVTVIYYCMTHGQPSVAICKSTRDMRIYNKETDITEGTFLCNIFCIPKDVPEWTF